MLLERHDWDCGHREVVDPSGQRVGADQVGDPKNKIADATPPYPCAMCSDPEGDLTHIGIVPGPNAVVMRWTNPLQLSIEDESTGIESAARESAVDEPDGAESPVESEGGVGVPESERFPLVEFEFESDDGLIGHVGAFDTDDLANYDPPYAGSFEQAQLDAMFSTHQRAVDNTDSQQRGIFQEQNDSQELTNYGNSDGVHQTSYPAQVRTIHYAPFGGHVRGFGQLSATATHYNPPGPPYGSPYHHNSNNSNNSNNNSHAIVPYGSLGRASNAMVQPPTPRIPTAPLSLRQIFHKSGKPCPESHASCHWHYSVWCHDEPNTCPLARKAISAAATNHDDWKGAPEGWNELHATCVRRDNLIPCFFHQRLALETHGHDIGN